MHRGGELRYLGAFQPSFVPLEERDLKVRRCSPFEFHLPVEPFLWNLLVDADVVDFEAGGEFCFFGVAAVGASDGEVEQDVVGLVEGVGAV